MVIGHIRSELKIRGLRPTETRSGAFTLIELLVVISIIGVLAGLLLTVLGAAKRKAQATECLSNLRQLYTATLLYADDQEDSLPFAWYPDPDPKINSFYSLLMPAIYTVGFDGYEDFELKIFSCPTRMREPLMGINPVRISYGMNAYNSTSYPSPRTRRLTAAQESSPASRVLLADIPASWNHPPLPSLDASHTGYKHERRANLACFDGHVGPHSLQCTNELILNY